MSFAETNLSLSVSTDRLREPAFKTVKRGYDPDQVLEYLTRVADRVQALETKVGALGSDLQQAREERDAALSIQSVHSPPGESASAHMRDLTVAFDEDVKRLRGEAEADALRLRAEAEVESERILADARREAQRAQVRSEAIRAAAEVSLEDAQDEAVKVVSDLAKRREATLRELSACHQQILEIVTNLAATIEEEQLSDRQTVIRIDRLDVTKDEAPGVLPAGLPEAPG